MWGNDRPAMPVGWSSVRRKILSREAQCYLCGEPATEVDHQTPRHQGGGEGVNLRPICKTCHRRKSSAEGVAKQRELRNLRRRPVGRHPGSS